MRHVTRRKVERTGLPVISMSIYFIQPDLYKDYLDIDF